MQSGTAFSYLESVSISRVVFIGDSARSNPRLWSDDGLLGHNRIVEVLPTNPELVLATTSDARV
jgi:hypothetical protein